MSDRVVLTFYFLEPHWSSRNEIFLKISKKKKVPELLFRIPVSSLLRVNQFIHLFFRKTSLLSPRWNKDPRGRNDGGKRNGESRKLFICRLCHRLLLRETISPSKIFLQLRPSRVRGDLRFRFPRSPHHARKAQRTQQWQCKLVWVSPSTHRPEVVSSGRSNRFVIFPLLFVGPRLLLLPPLRPRPPRPPLPGRGSPHV